MFLTKKFFPPLSFLPVFGSGIRDPGSGMGKNQDPGSGINIPDPQHCLKHNKVNSLNLKKEILSTSMLYFSLAFPLSSIKGIQGVMQL
jgi:hypothetical protein